MRTVVTVLAAVVMAVPGFAQDGQPAGGGVVVASSQSDRPAVLEALRARGARTTALGVRGGLMGWYVDLGSGDAYSLYLTADGHAVAGLLYGPDGSLLTGAQLAAAKVDLRPSASVGGGASQGADGRLHTGGDRRASERDLFDRSGEAFGFTVGEAGPVVVVFGTRAALTRGPRRLAWPVLRWVAGSGCGWSRLAFWARRLRERQRLSRRAGIRPSLGSAGTNGR